MMWKNDDQCEIKDQIFELIRKDMSGKISPKLTLRDFIDNINVFIDACNEGKRLTTYNENLLV